MLLCSCNTLPQLYKSVEDIADNDAVDIMLSNEVFDSGKDVSVVITIANPNIPEKK